MTAELKLFPASHSPLTADLIAQYKFLVERLAPRGYNDGCLSAHERSLGSNEELAALFRSPTCIEDVGEAAANFAQSAHVAESIGEAQDRAAASAIARYKRGIAGQLAALARHPLRAAAVEYLAELDRRDRAAATAAAEATVNAEAAARADRELAKAAARADAERTATEIEAVVAAELAEIDRAQLDERRRVAAVATLRYRLQKTNLQELRMSDKLYGTRALSFAVGDYSEADARAALERLDRAEAELL